MLGIFSGDAGTFSGPLSMASARGVLRLVGDHGKGTAENER
jgi:hypothetical protein